MRTTYRQAASCLSLITDYDLLTDANAHYLRRPTYLHALQADPPRDTYNDPDTGYSVFTQVSE